jgi:hypothetical protein
MPVQRCSNGKWRIGDGPCIYTTEELANRAYGAYLATLRERKEIVSKEIKKAVAALCTPDAAYLAARLAAQEEAGVLSVVDDDDSYSSITEGRVPLCHRDEATGMLVIHGVVEGEWKSTFYKKGGASAVAMLGPKIGPNQAAEFGMVPGPVCYHKLYLAEFYGEPVTAEDMPATSPEISPYGESGPVAPVYAMKRADEPEGDGEQDADKAVWSTAYINDLKDSAFLHIEPGGEKDDEGKTKPRSLRHFPFKDKEGNINIDHVRNAIAQAPKSSLPEDVQQRVQEKARKILAAQKSETKKSIGQMDVSALSTDELVGVFNRLYKKANDGVVRADEPSPSDMVALGACVLTEMRKRGIGVDAGDNAFLGAIDGYCTKVHHCTNAQIDDAQNMRVPLTQQVSSKDLTDRESLPNKGRYTARICKRTNVAIGPDGIDPDWVYVLGKVLEPNDGQGGAPVDPDYQGEVYSKEAIRKAAILWGHKYRQSGVMHEGQVLSDQDARFAFNWVIEDGWNVTTDAGEKLREGTWIVGMLVRRASHAGKQIEAGVLNAFSIDGLAERKPELVKIAA